MSINSKSVPVGLSEVVTLLTLIGSVLTALFGRDWGVTANAQQYAGVAVVLLPIGLSISRAIKHHGSAVAAVTALTALLPATALVPATAPAVADVADPFPGEAGHTEIEMLLLVLAVVGVFLLLFGVTLH